MWSGIGVLGGSVCGCEGGDGGVSCNLLRFGCRRVPTVLCLLCYGGTLAAWFSSLHPSGRSLECFLIDAGDPPTPGLLMRKAPRTQKIQQTLLPDLCEVLPGMPRHGVHAAAPSYACQAARGSARGRGLTLGSLVMCATSKRIRLRPPPLISGPHCGLQGECVEVMRPWCSSAPTATSTARH